MLKYLSNILEINVVVQIVAVFHYWGRLSASKMFQKPLKFIQLIIFGYLRRCWPSDSQGQNIIDINSILKFVENYRF